MDFNIMDNDSIFNINSWNEKVKIYVDVIAICKADATVLPVSIIWGNGKKYDIDKVISIQNAQSLKDSRKGFRYKCRIGQRTFYLYYDGSRWYVDK